MGKSCCAVGCTNRYRKGSGVHFYRFPDDKERRAKWIAAVARKNWEPTEHSWICSAHFVSGAKDNNPLSPDYVPSVFSYIKSPVKRKLEEGMKRFERVSQAKKRRVETGNKLEAARSLLKLSDTGNGVTFCEPHSGVFTMTDLAMNDLKELEVDRVKLSDSLQAVCRENLQLIEENKNLTIECAALRDKNQALELENEQLRSYQSSALTDQEPFGETVFEGHNEKVKYYTGLPNYKTLISVYKFASSGIVPGNRSSLSLFQRFIMVLIKLRLNLGDQDLAYRFNVDQSTVTRHIQKWIEILYVRLGPLVKWPDRSELLRTMPMSFRRSYGKCIIIIDCFEVFIERPTNLMARAQTWSNYKHHNTVKFLIGISPQGAVTYISKAWGGRVSDVHLTEHCDLLEKLLPGDLILADQGFNIQDSAGLYCAEVKLPPFTRGKKQLSKAEVDVSRKLSHVRIHVERVIGLVRQK